MKYEVTIKTVYIQEVEVDADDELEAKEQALKQFYPDPAYIFSMDVFGLDPWRPDSPLEDILHDQYRQRELDDE